MSLGLKGVLPGCIRRLKRLFKGVVGRVGDGLRGLKGSPAMGPRRSVRLTRGLQGLKGVRPGTKSRTWQGSYSRSQRSRFGVEGKDENGRKGKPSLRMRFEESGLSFKGEAPPLASFALLRSGLCAFLHFDASGKGGEGRHGWGGGKKTSRLQVSDLQPL